MTSSLLIDAREGRASGDGYRWCWLLPLCLGFCQESLAWQTCFWRLELLETWESNKETSAFLQASASSGGGPPRASPPPPSSLCVRQVRHLYLSWLSAWRSIVCHPWKSDCSQPLPSPCPHPVSPWGSRQRLFPSLVALFTEKRVCQQGWLGAGW